MVEQGKRDRIRTNTGGAACLLNGRPARACTTHCMPASWRAGASLLRTPRWVGWRSSMSPWLLARLWLGWVEAGAGAAGGKGRVAAAAAADRAGGTGPRQRSIIELCEDAQGFEDCSGPRRAWGWEGSSGRVAGRALGVPTERWREIGVQQAGKCAASENGALHGPPPSRPFTAASQAPLSPRPAILRVIPKSRNPLAARHEWRARNGATHVVRFLRPVLQQAAGQPLGAAGRPAGQPQRATAESLSPAHTSAESLRAMPGGCRRAHDVR